MKFRDPWNPASQQSALQSPLSPSASICSVPMLSIDATRRLTASDSAGSTTSLTATRHRRHATLSDIRTAGTFGFDQELNPSARVPLHASPHFMREQQPGGSFPRSHSISTTASLRSSFAVSPSMPTSPIREVPPSSSGILQPPAPPIARKRTYQARMRKAKRFEDLDLDSSRKSAPDTGSLLSPSLVMPPAPLSSGSMPRRPPLLRQEARYEKRSSSISSQRSLFAFSPDLPVVEASDIDSMTPPLSAASASSFSSIASDERRDRISQDGFEAGILAMQQALAIQRMAHNDVKVFQKEIDQSEHTMLLSATLKPPVDRNRRNSSNVAIGDTLRSSHRSPSVKSSRMSAVPSGSANGTPTRANQGRRPPSASSDLGMSNRHRSRRRSSASWDDGDLTFRRFLSASPSGGTMHASGVPCAVASDSEDDVADQEDLDDRDHAFVSLPWYSRQRASVPSAS